MKPAPGWIWAVVRIAIGCFFAYAGLTKILDPIENFRGTIAQYQVIPYPMISFVAAVVPWMEFISGVLMMAGYAPKYTAWMIAALCVGFLTIMGASDSFLEMGGKDCGCFGEGSLIHFTMYQMFALDFINLLLCLRLANLKEHAFSLDRWLRA